MYDVTPLQKAQLTRPLQSPGPNFGIVPQSEIGKFSKTGFKVKKIAEYFISEQLS